MKQTICTNVWKTKQLETTEDEAEIKYSRKQSITLQRVTTAMLCCGSQ